MPYYVRGPRKGPYFRELASYVGIILKAKTPGLRRQQGCAVSGCRPQAVQTLVLYDLLKCNIGALIVRIGFGVSYAIIIIIIIRTPPQKKKKKKLCSNYQGPYIRFLQPQASRGLRSLLRNPQPETLVPLPVGGSRCPKGPK